MSQQQFEQNYYVKGINALATPYDSSQITLCVLLTIPVVEQELFDFLFAMLNVHV
jgi:hypothetical protein